MSWTRVQGGSNSAASVTTLTANGGVGNITTGNLVVGSAAFFYSSTVPTVTVKTTAGTSFNIKVNVTDTNDLVVFVTFVLGNISGTPAGVTVTSSPASSILLQWDEYSGGTALSDPTDGTAFTSNTQNLPGTGANALTSTAIVPATNGDLIYGSSLDTGNSTAITAGTSPNAFTARQTVSLSAVGYILGEEFIQTTAASIAATAGSTSGGADNFITAVIALKAASAAAQGPFVQKDWPTPTAPAREPGLLSWALPYNLCLYQGLDKLPVRQLEWQVPRAAEPYPYRSFEAFYNRNLIGKDKFFDGPGNVPDFDYPVPRSPESYPYRTWTQNLLQTTLAPSLAKPLNQYDWPVPRGAEPDWRRSWEFWFNKNLIGKDQLPVRQLDWQLPSRGAEPYPYRSWEWKYNSNLVGQDQFPFRQFDWQLPQAPAKIDQSWVVNLQLSTLAPVVVTIPFRQFDWPVPQGYPPLAQNWVQPLNLNLQLTFMMLPFEWDILEGAQFANPSSAQNLLLTTLSTPLAPVPFAQFNWPLPATSQYIERTSAQNLLLTTLVPPPVTGMPFRQLDWRLPDFFLR